MKKIILLVVSLFLGISVSYAKEVNLENLSNLKTYEINDYSTFLKDYENNNLDDVYVTKFLFDGAGMYKDYDIDDFIENGNDSSVKVVETNVINISKIGDYTFSGELTGGMIAVNTNDCKGNINIILNGVKLDTDSKKIPVIYVYNKDITSTSCKVTIKTSSNTDNYLEGGKLKKISLIPKENLSEYIAKYNTTNSANYTKYSNYYGVYTSKQIENILFATVEADNEDLKDGDPVYFYKAAGAISSDIDLYFEGNGYLEVVSKNKEGIETKGNLTFSGGTGDYLINSQDDSLNTTTTLSSNKNAHNTITIDVNSLYAIVDSEADEGDAIDSNGKLIINGGRIVAIAKSGSDAGLDSQNGTYINGGEVFATGDMLDEISSESKQNYIVLSFDGSASSDKLYALLNSKDEVLFAFNGDRNYSNIIYSSSKLQNGNYYLYIDGEIVGEEKNGYYININSYKKGTWLGYSSLGSNGFGRRGHRIDNTTSSNASYNEFTINGISNKFSGIKEYTGSGNNTLVTSNNNTIIYIGSGLFIACLGLLIYFIIRNNKNSKKEILN